MEYTCIANFEYFFVLKLETWSLTLREEHRLRVFEKRVLRRMFIPKMEERFKVQLYLYTYSLKDQHMVTKN
jgi:hypothetical protein